MKRKLHYLLIILIGALLIAAVDTFAQTTTDNAVIKYGADFTLIMKDVSIDSAGTIWTQAFKLDNYNGGSSCKLECALNTNNADSVKIIYDLYRNYIDPDSLAYWSLLSPIDTVTSAALTYCTETISTQATWYKIKIANQAGAQANTFDLGIISAIKED